MAYQKAASDGGARRMTAESPLSRFAAVVLSFAAGGAAALAGGGVWQAGGASAATLVCVTCFAPEGRYRCEVTADGGDVAPPSLPLLCAARIAQDNGHGSCSVVRETQSAARSGFCDGPVRAYRLSELAPPAAAANDPSLNDPSLNDPSRPPGGGASDAGADAPAGEPATLADMTQETLDRSRENARRAGEALEDAGAKARGVFKGARDAVGGVTERTLKCLGSGFGDC